AAHAAKDVGARLAFLDLDSRSVLSRLLASMSAKEKVRFAISILGGLFVRKSTVEKELQKFEANEGAFIDELAREFPSVKRAPTPQGFEGRRGDDRLGPRALPTPLRDDGPRPSAPVRPPRVRVHVLGGGDDAASPVVQERGGLARFPRTPHADARVLLERVL